MARREAPRIGLALGGGGARGLAHIGVLKVLEREKIPVACLAGTSMGSIIGAMYAQLRSAAALEERIRNYFASDRYREIAKRMAGVKSKADANPGLVDRMVTFVKQSTMVKKAFSELGLLDRAILDAALRSLLDEEDIRDTRIPFAAVATDLWKGEDVVLRKGSLRRAVTASATIPGTFPPVEMDGRYLVDGCVIQMVPVHEARSLGADRVVAVDVTRELVRPPAFKNGLEVMFRADEITNFRLNEIHLSAADVVIRPRMGNMHWASFELLDDIVRRGEAAAEEKLGALRDLSAPPGRRWFGFLRRLQFRP
jgi:NTE family protein